MESDVEDPSRTTLDLYEQNTTLDDFSYINPRINETLENGDIPTSRHRLGLASDDSHPPEPEHLTGSDVPHHHHHINDDVMEDPRHADDSLDSIIVEKGVVGKDLSFVGGGGLKGLDNEAYSYDGDAEWTDLSYSNPASPVNPPVLRDPNPFPVLERPLSGRYHKNPQLEKNKAAAPPGPYDPHVGLYLAPPLATTKTSPSSASGGGGGEGGGGGRGVRRIPQPPSRLRMRCAFGWSCLACLIGNFLCAIPALRYFVTANESRKIGDYNSANSFLRKTAILAAVALVLGVAAWTVVILYLSGSLN